MAAQERRGKSKRQPNTERRLPAQKTERIPAQKTERLPAQKTERLPASGWAERVGQTRKPRQTDGTPPPRAADSPTRRLPAVRAAEDNTARSAGQSRRSARRTVSRASALLGVAASFVHGAHALFELFLTKLPFVSGAAGERRTKGKNRPPILFAGAVAAVALLLFAVGFGVHWLTTNQNAMIVYMNGEKIGTVDYEPSLTAESVQKTAEAKLKSSVGGVNVAITDKVTAELAHDSGEGHISMDELLERLYTGFSYEVEACVITVNGIEMAVVRTLADAQAIQGEIQAGYDQEYLNITGASFVEDVQNTLRFVDESDIMTNEKALARLSQEQEAEVLYTVQSGDVLGSIATDSGMTIADLVRLNPGLDPEAFLQIGQQLVLSVPKPLLSVRTVERVTYQAVAEKTTERQENPDEYVTYSKVLQQGKDGQKEVTEDIIRVNGAETERLPVSEKITVEPITEIIEVGTNETPPQHAVGTFVWPARGRITDRFGSRGGTHDGLDIANSYGTAVYASDGGKVVRAGWYSGYGLTVIIDHENGFETYYGHNSVLLVSVGQMVAQGEQIAEMGSTGNSTGNHCHFELHKNGVPQNPTDYLG